MEKEIRLKEIRQLIVESKNENAMAEFVILSIELKEAGYIVVT